LSQLKAPKRPELLRGTEDFEDAALYELPNGDVLVSTLDFIPPLVENPFHYGQIAAANAISDVFSMGGQPILALNIVCFPSNKLGLEILGEILEGVNTKISESGAALGGGHSVDDDEIKIGLSVNGLVSKENYLLNSGAQEGDVIILTKAIGTGPLSSAVRKGQVSDEALDEWVTSMTRLNKLPEGSKTKHHLHACTDVTGFGLIGHLAEMARAAKAHIELDCNSVPFLKDAEMFMGKGHCTKGVKRNVDYTKDVLKLKQGSSLNSVKSQLVCDSETSGGLLIALPENKAKDFIKVLQDCGHTSSQQIAVVRDNNAAQVSL
jgi:selenide,water dikinase